MVDKEESKKKESYFIRIGPLLKKVLDNQKESIGEVTYGVVDSSYYVAGEVHAKKVLGLA